MYHYAVVRNPVTDIIENLHRLPDVDGTAGKHDYFDQVVQQLRLLNISLDFLGGSATSADSSNRLDLLLMSSGLLGLLYPQQLNYFVI